MRRRQTWVVIVGVLFILAIVYAGTGIVYAGTLVGSAERTLNTVVSHENSLTTSFNEIDQEVAVISQASFNPEQAIALVDRSVANSEVATQTIFQDDGSLASVQGQLDGSRWLTVVGHGSIDRESTRVRHARNALAAAKAIASDQVLDGQYWRALYTSLADLDQLETQVNAGDYTSAKTTWTTMKGHVDQAVQLSRAPDLPPDLQSFMVDLQTFAADYGKQLDALAASDDTTVAQLEPSVATDRQKLAAYSFDKIGSEIDAFYKPLVDRFNSEITAATS